MQIADYCQFSDAATETSIALLFQLCARVSESNRLLCQCLPGSHTGDRLVSGNRGSMRNGS